MCLRALHGTPYSGSVYTLFVLVRLLKSQCRAQPVPCNAPNTKASPSWNHSISPSPCHATPQIQKPAPRGITAFRPARTMQRPKYKSQSLVESQHFAQPVPCNDPNTKASPSWNHSISPSPCHATPQIQKPAPRGITAFRPARTMQRPKYKSQPLVES